MVGLMEVEDGERKKHIMVSTIRPLPGDPICVNEVELKEMHGEKTPCRDEYTSHNNSNSSLSSNIAIFL